MRIFLLLLTLFVIPALTKAQDDLNSGSACSHIGGCNISVHHDDCDSSCEDARREARREQAEKDNKAHREWQEWHDAQKAAEREAREARKEAKNLEKANKLAAEAWELEKQSWVAGQEGKCKKALELYKQALDITAFTPWIQNRAACQWTLGNWRDAFGGFEYVAADKDTSPENLKRVKWAMWSIEYEQGRLCPEPPAFDGHKGCVGRPVSQRPKDFIPLPTVDGRFWTPRNFSYSKGGSFTIKTNDGHEYHQGDDLLNVNLLHSTIITNDDTHIRFTLPDGHDFVQGPNTICDITSYIYDPNISTADMWLSRLNGVVRIVAGTLQKMMPQTTIVREPQLVAAVRGTDVVIIQRHIVPQITQWNNDSTPYETLRILARDGEAELILPKDPARKSYCGTLADKRTLCPPVAASDGNMESWSIPKGTFLDTMSYDSWRTAEEVDIENYVEFNPDWFAYGFTTDDWDMVPVKGRELE
jgi:hypothetical protein